MDLLGEGILIFEHGRYSVNHAKINSFVHHIQRGLAIDEQKSLDQFHDDFNALERERETLTRNLELWCKQMNEDAE